MKMKKRLKRAIPIVFGVLLTLTAIFCPGCANQMFQHGWAIETRPVVTPTVGYLSGPDSPTGPNTPASVVKRDDGSLMAVYDVASRRYGFLGSWGGASNLGVTRTTNVVAASELAPASVVDWRFDADEIRIPTNALAGVPAGAALPIIHQWDQDAKEFRYPPVECVFITYGNVFWLVPPTIPGEEPRMALIEGHEEHTSWYIWPARVVSYPFVLAGDMVIWPPYLIALWLGLAEPM
jgi:hypothetical protein